MNPPTARVAPAYAPLTSAGGFPFPASGPSSSAGEPPQAQLTQQLGFAPAEAQSAPESVQTPVVGFGNERMSTDAPSCPKCGNATTGLPFCAYCGTRVGARVSVEIGSGGAPPRSVTSAIAFTAARIVAGPKLTLLSDTGESKAAYTLDHGEAVIGRTGADISFPDDNFLSPLHARLDVRNGELFLRDLGSRNGTWLFIDSPFKLSDCDLLLVGSQFIRFRRLGYPGPHPPEADSTRRIGSAVPKVDIAVLEQLRADGSVRDVFHLSPGRSIEIGRETGDWIFPYDATMSGRHAEVRSEDSEFFVHDANSRNGVATSVRGERVVKRGQRLLVGDQILRVESV